MTQAADRRALRRRAVTSGACLIASLALWALSHWPWFVEAVYARAPLQARLGWPLMVRPAGEAEPRMDDQIATLAAELIEATNESYRAATGFYFPFTGEPNYNGDAPASGVPHAMAHEKSHQRGIALEDEAHFIAYLACVMSDDPYAQYSGYLFGQSGLLGELWWRSPAQAGALRKRRSAGVNRDLQFRRDYWARYEGLPERIGSAVNDRYLRSQGIAAGVGSYAASGHLLILFARQHGGVTKIKR